MSPSNRAPERDNVPVDPTSRLTRTFLRLPPARLLLLGYLGYVLAGWFLLNRQMAQDVPLGMIDTLFIATSALSTTGLATVDPGTSFSFFGEMVILLLMQIGGLGYMTFGSWVYLATQHRLSAFRNRAARATFGLPPGTQAAGFLRSVIAFTLAIETAGALLLWVIFASQGVPDAAWQAVFHSVSAFCTAGFSLFPTSFEAWRGDVAVNVVISALSILGGMGFLIVVDLWNKVRGDVRPTGLSATVILRLTLWMIGGGAVLLFFVDPGIAALAPGERVMASFFQSMTAATTVGFDTVAPGTMATAALVVLMPLMLIGASPAGTGGGLKTTTLAALFGLVHAVIRNRSEVVVMHRVISAERVRLAAAALCYYLMLMLVALFALSLTETAAFEAILFEVISAMSTVGLSMGITGGLSDTGKIILTLLMFAGRVGILSFGIAIAFRRAEPDPGPQEHLIL